MTDVDLAPEATPETPATPDATQELEALRAKYERAQKDLTKFRTRAEEVEAAQKAAAEKALAEADAVKRAELLQAKVTELEAAKTEALAEAAAARRRAALTGKVADVDLALAVADRHALEDGTVDVDALLAAHPSLAPTKQPSVATSGSGGTPRAPTPTTQVEGLLKSGRQEDKALAAAILAQSMK